MHGDEAMTAFTRHYRDAANPDFAQPPYWDLYRDLYWDLVAALSPASRIADWAGGRAELGRPDVTEKGMRAGPERFGAHALAALPPAPPRTG